MGGAFSPAFSCRFSIAASKCFFSGFSLEGLQPLIVCWGQPGTMLAAAVQAGEEDESSRIAEAFTVKGMQIMDTQWAEAVGRVEQSAEYIAAMNSTAGVDQTWKKAKVYDEYQLILAKVREMDAGYVPETAPPSPAVAPQPRSQTPGARKPTAQM